MELVVVGWIYGKCNFTSHASICEIRDWQFVQSALGVGIIKLLKGFSLLFHLIRQYLCPIVYGLPFECSADWMARSVQLDEIVSKAQVMGPDQPPFGSFGIPELSTTDTVAGVKNP